MATDGVDTGSKQTAAIGHYDGIFKFVHEQAAQDTFRRARRLLAQDQWDEAVAAFQEAKIKAKDNAHDVKTLELILDEMARYKDHLIPKDLPPKAVDWSSVSRRSLDRLEEPHDRLPQGVFFLTLKNPKETDGRKLRLVGRKTVSDKWLQNLIPELFCSLVRPDMLLGLLEDLRVTEKGVSVFYRPLESAEKLQVFQGMYDDGGRHAEVTFPFPLLKTVTRKEFTSPAEGWEVDDVYDDMLSNGELHIRAYVSKVFLQGLEAKNPRLYDPACSTGIFLSSLKAARPDAYTIGQDLSEQMARVSRERLDEAHHGNALVPKIQQGSAQAVFIRFLNSEVVTSAEAEVLLPPLLTTVAVGGFLVVLGHTPVLLSSANFQSLKGFQLERCVATDVEKQGIFQFYVLKRIE